jgi:hypothetical protein
VGLAGGVRRVGGDGPALRGVQVAAALFEPRFHVFVGEGGQPGQGLQAAEVGGVGVLCLHQGLGRGGQGA